MRAFLAAVGAAIVIAVASAVVLDGLGFSSANRFAGEATRLDSR